MAEQTETQVEEINQVSETQESQADAELEAEQAAEATEEKEPIDMEAMSIDAWDLKTDAESHEVDAEKKYIRATLLFDKGDIDEALMLIRAALSLCPGNAKYHYNIGYLYWLKGLLEIAINHYKLYLRYAPSTDKDIQTIKDRVKYLENELKNRQKPK